MVTIVPCGAAVTVVMASDLITSLRALPTALQPAEAAAVYELARRSTTWNPHPDPAEPPPGSTPH